MKVYNVKIKANKMFPYYMQHKMNDEEFEKKIKRSTKVVNGSAEKKDNEIAEGFAYRNNKGQLYIPSCHIKGSLINGGKAIKAKVGNARKSMANIVAGEFFVRGPKEAEELPIAQKYVADKRTCVNRNIKARVITIRPKWKDWKTNFLLYVDNDSIPDDTVKSIIEEAGKHIGIGSYTPRQNGEFGRFDIEKFDKIKEE